MELCTDKEHNDIKGNSSYFSYAVLHLNMFFL